MKYWIFFLFLLSLAFAGIDNHSTRGEASDAGTPEPQQQSATEAPTRVFTTENTYQAQQKKSYRPSPKVKHQTRRKKARRSDETIVSIFVVVIVLAALSFLIGGIGGLVMMAANVGGFAGNTALLGALLTGLSAYLLFLVGVVTAIGNGYNGPDNSLSGLWFFMTLTLALSTFTMLALFQVGWFATFAAFQASLIAVLALILIALLFAIF